MKVAKATKAPQHKQNQPGSLPLDQSKECRAGLIFAPYPQRHTEPKVSNEEFLSSLVEYGCWFRVLAADKERRTLSDSESTPLERYAAISSFYQHLGMLLEDIVTSLVTWSAWAKDRTLYLADLNERLALSTGDSSKASTEAYHEEVAEALATSAKRVRVNPSLYVRSIMALDRESVLNWIGIPWKRIPSVKTVVRKDWDAWSKLPRAVDTLDAMLGEENPLIVSCYNKLKHGPQAVVSNLKTTMQKRGSSDDLLASFADDKYVRLLFDGATTQRGGDLYVAPFLLHEPYFVNSVFYHRVVVVALANWNLCAWLLYTQFTKRRASITDARIRQIFKEGVEWEGTQDWLDLSDALPELLAASKRQ